MKKALCLTLILFLISQKECLSVFEHLVGQTVTLRCRSSSPQFLDGNTTDNGGAVYLSPRTDWDRNTNLCYSGTHWVVERHPEGEYALRCDGDARSTKYRYLDGNTTQDNKGGTVYLSPHANKAYSGTRWKPRRFPDGTYALECWGDVSSQQYKFLQGVDERVCLTRNTNNEAAHWEINLSFRFPHATSLSCRDMMRCVAACRAAKERRLGAEDAVYWQGDKWEHGGDGAAAPTFQMLSINSDDSVLIRGNRDYQSGALIAKGRQVFVAFPGAQFWEGLEDWKTFSLFGRDLSEGDGRFDRDGLKGYGHLGAFLKYQAFSDDLVSGGNGKGGKIRAYAASQGLNVTDLQMIFVGHSFGGMVNHYAAYDAINRLLPRKRNTKNNVVVVSLGTPRVFEPEAAARWEEKVGEGNHLRITTQNDHIVDVVPFFPLVASLKNPLKWQWKVFSGEKLFFRSPVYTGAPRQLAMSGLENHGLTRYMEAFRQEYERP